MRSEGFFYIVDFLDFLVYLDNQGRTQPYFGSMLFHVVYPFVFALYYGCENSDPKASRCALVADPILTYALYIHIYIV